MRLVAIAVGLVARGVGAGACRIRVPTPVRIVGIISIGSIVVVGWSVRGRSIGAVAISRGVGRGMVSVVGGGIAAVAAIGTGGHHCRLAGIPAHVNLLVISTPLVYPMSSIAVSVSMSIPVTVAVPIAAVSTVVRIPVSISTIAVSTMAVTTVSVASIASVTSIPIIAIVGPLNGSGQQASQKDEDDHDDLIECEAGDNSVDSHV